MEDDIAVIGVIRVEHVLITQVLYFTGEFSTISHTIAFICINAGSVFSLFKRMEVSFMLNAARELFSYCLFKYLQGFWVLYPRQQYALCLKLEDLR